MSTATSRATSRILVLGATGGTGRALVAQAVTAGHDVSVFVRRGFEAPGVNVLRGDAFDPAAVADAVRGHDVVISCLGTRPWRHRDICTGGTRNILAGMKTHGVRRLIVMSSLGVGDSIEDTGLLRPLMRLAIGKALDDKAVMEQDVRASDVEWVIARPALLTGGKGRGHVRVAATGRPGWFVSRADVARFLLEQCRGDEWLRRLPVVA